MYGSSFCRSPLIDSALLGLPDFDPGSVWLVGAGPGDPGLLSALALHALARADCVVYEALALAAAGIPFRIVPGITAGIGGLAYAGIPVTHRETNSAVTFLTGHDSDGKVSGGLDWEAIARGAPVLVLYMASRNLSNIANRLLACGRGSDEPVAIISKATTPAQSVLVSTLAEIVEALPTIQAPAIIVIGDVVRLRSALGWFGTQHQSVP